MNSYKGFSDINGSEYVHSRENDKDIGKFTRKELKFIRIEKLCVLWGKATSFTCFGNDEIKLSLKGIVPTSGNKTLLKESCDCFMVKAEL